MWIIIDDRTPKKKFETKNIFFGRKTFVSKTKKLLKLSLFSPKAWHFFLCEVSGSCKFAKDEVGTFWFFSYLLLVSYF